MAAENIGQLIPTKIPGYSDPADIQAALRLYHYGSYTYDPNETNPSNLVSPSIAHTINSLQSQISGINAISPNVFNAKGDILTATADNTPSILSAGSNGQVLTLNSSTATGLQWSTPEVTPSNSITFTNKTLTAPRITSGSNIADSNGNELIVFPSVVASAVNEITIRNGATGLGPAIEASGNDTNISLFLNTKGSGVVQVNDVPVVTTTDTQTLTNKTLTSPVINLSTNARAASYTLVLSDASKIVEMSVASANTLTIPLNSSHAFAVGTQIIILQTGAGQTTIAGTGGVTVNGTPGLKLRAQWSSATLIKRATDTWVAIGDLVA